MKNLHYSTNIDSYNEAEALQQLLKAASEALADTCSALEDNKDLAFDFTITVNGVQTAFICGAPQIEALYRFVSYVATENMYIVDFNKMTVTGWK